MKHIDPKKLQIGDILCTTDASLFATVARGKTWGDTWWDTISRMDHGTHNAIVCDRGGGLLYACEMKPSGGPEMTELSVYDNGPGSWLNHICCVKRHPMLSFPTTQQRLNDYMIQKHAFKVKYGYEELLRFYIPSLPDDPYTMICSMWPLFAYRDCNLSLPDAWKNTKVLLSPADWQRADFMVNVEGAIK